MSCHICVQGVGILDLLDCCCPDCEAENRHRRERFEKEHGGRFEGHFFVRERSLSEPHQSQEVGPVRDRQQGGRR